MGYQKRDGRKSRKNVAGKFRLGDGKEDDTEDGPAYGEPRRFFRASRAPQLNRAVNREPDQKRGPRKESHQQHRGIKPEGLDMLEFRSEVALEIVFDDENAKEIRVAACADDIPGQSRRTHSNDAHRMKQ